MKDKKQILDNINRRIKICRHEIVSIDEDIKSKIDSISSSDGLSLSLTQMCHAIRQKLNESEEKISELDELSRGLATSDDLYREIRFVIGRYRQESVNNLKNLRAASQRALKNVEFEERSSLLSKATGNGSEMRQRSAKLSQQSADFSDGLTQLLRTMDGEVKRSEETLKTLVDSSQVITETDLEFRTMSSAVTSTGKLLSKFGRREMTDRILFLFAFLFFFGVVLYIIKKRMLSL
uniref:Vesicle transport protein SEC20 n=1 Tax=Romanomermis culicivorax TaxID=13658 RepID=A0A915HZU6_ROMCU